MKNSYINPTIFILEGPDGCGKSTLASHMVEHLCGVRHQRAIKWHLTYTQKLGLAMEDYMINQTVNAVELVKCHETHVIFDRHWPSEAVYGKIMRPNMPFKHDIVKSMFNGINLVYIFCLSPLAVIDHEYKKDPDHPYSRDLFQQIVGGYEQLAREMIVEPNSKVYFYNKYNDGENKAKFIDAVLQENCTSYLSSPNA